MPIQPEPILRGAVRWLERVPTHGTARARSLLTTLPQFSDLTPTQYETSLRWLERSDLLTKSDARDSAALRIFRRAVLEAEWFRDADILVRSPDELPDDAWRLAEALGIETAGAYQEVVATWGKVDTAARERIGAAGEAELVALLRSSVNGSVEHVASWSDGYGYDVSVSGGTITAHLEVKSTNRSGRLRIFLSRFEFEVMRRDPHWRMVAVQLSTDLKITRVSTVSSTWLAASAPYDRADQGRWESCRIEVPLDVVEMGIPILTPILRSDRPSLLADRSVLVAN